MWKKLSVYGLFTQSFHLLSSFGGMYLCFGVRGVQVRAETPGGVGAFQHRFIIVCIRLFRFLARCEVRKWHVFFCGTEAARVEAADLLKSKLRE